MLTKTASYHKSGKCYPLVNHLEQKRKEGTMTHKEFVAGIRSDDKDLALACGLFYLVLRMKEEAEKKEKEIK